MKEYPVNVEYWESFPGVSILGSNRNVDKWREGHRWVVVTGPNTESLVSMHKTKELAARGIAAWKRKLAKEGKAE